MPLLRPCLLAALLLAGSLSACSPDGSDDGDGATPETPSSDSAAQPPVLELLSERVVVDPLPDPEGTVEVVGRAVYTKAQKRALSRDTGFFDQPDVAVTDELVVVAPATRLVTAVDRASGEVVWAKRPRGLDGESICRLVHPAPDSEVVVLVTSSTCERFTRIDLRTGKVVGTTQLDLFELASSTLATGIATVGPHTFVGRDTVAGSSISVFDEEGELREVVEDDDLGLDEDQDLDVVMALPGSDVIVAVLSSEQGVDTTRESGRSETYVGLRVLPDASLEEIWRVGGVELRESLRPRARLVQSSTGVTLFERETPEGVLWSTTIRRGGREVPRLSAMDPETGLFSGNFVLDKRAPGLPSWQQTQFFSWDTLADGDEVFSLTLESGELVSLGGYDLGAGKVSWAWEPKIPHQYPPVLAELIALTSDDEYVYASGNADLDTVVVKLDRDTGKPVAQWRFDDRFDSTFDRARKWLVGDLLIWVPDGVGATLSRDYLAITRLG